MLFDAAAQCCKSNGLSLMHWEEQESTVTEQILTKYFYQILQRNSDYVALIVKYKLGECWKSPTQKRCVGINLCRHDRGMSDKCADIWLSGWHVIDMLATFPAKFTWHCCPQDEQIFCSYGSHIFRPCMCTGLVIEASPSNHYWRRYEVWQWLVLGWFGGYGTLNTQLARQKLGKKHTPQSWRPPSPYDCHGALLRAQPCTAISQHTAQQVYVIKTRKYYCFYYLLAILRHDALSTHRACVFAGCISGRHWTYHTLSRQRWEFDALSACWEYGYSQRQSWEHHTLSAAHWEYDTLTAVWLCYYDISGGNKKMTIGNTDDCRLTPLVNSASTVLSISLPLKRAKFCHTLNILLVGHQHHCALWQLYFNSSAVSWSFVGRSVGPQ